MQVHYTCHTVCVSGLTVAEEIMFIYFFYELKHQVQIKREDYMANKPCELMVSRCAAVQQAASITSEQAC